MKETLLFPSLQICLILSIALRSGMGEAPSTSWYRQIEKPTCQVTSCCLPRTSLECQIALKSEMPGCTSSIDPVSQANAHISCSRDGGRCARIDLMLMTRQSNLEQLRVENCTLDNKVFADKLLPVKYGAQIINKGFLSRKFDTLLFAEIYYPDVDPSLCPIREITLKNVRLMRIPTNFFWSCPGLTSIDLAHNQIYTVGETDFWTIVQYTSVTSLILDHNYIHAFGEDVVTSTMKSLVKILKNKLTQVFGTSFKRHKNDICNVIGICSEKRLPSLRQLAKLLSMRKIYGLDVHFDFIYGKSSLSYLSLNYNQLTTIPDAIFGLSQLTHLHLAHNRISDSALNRQGHYIFRLVTRLKTLNLEGNQITRLEGNTFAFLVHLESLNLAYNKLARLPPLLLKPLSKLVSLNLAGNTLSTLSESATLGALRILNASHNALQSVSRGMTRYWPALETLDLSHNRIASVEAGAFSSLLQLRLLKLTGNLLHIVPAASFLTSHRPLLADRVGLALFDSASASRHSPMYHCDCRSVFHAIAHEEANNGFLPFFKYPKLLLPPPAASAYRCINAERRVVGVARDSHDYAYCSVRDLACPRGCRCCCPGNGTAPASSVEECGCTFQCPAGCRCFRTLSWDRVRVECRGAGLQFLPTSFSGQHLSPAELPLVTELRVSGADVGVLGSEAASSCPRGIGAVAVLSLTQSRVQRVRPDAFRCFRRLRHLSLAGNRLAALPATAELLGASAETLQELDLGANRLARVSARTFSGLRSLVLLNLAGNPLRCDCAWEAAFLRWADGERAQGVNVSLPPSCAPSPALRRYGGLGAGIVRFRRHTLEPACARMRVAVDAARRLWLGVGLGLALLLMTTVCTLLGYRYRFAVLLRLEERVSWPPARRLLRLPLAHERPIDVVLVFHERQTGEEHEVANFIRATGRGLEVRRVAYYMPGALVADQLASLAERVAVCVVFLSRELLDDARFMDPFRAFLRRCSESGQVHLVPVYPKAEADVEPVAHHTNFRVVEAALGAVNGLRWGSPNFWERLRLVLPPARHDDDGDDVPLLDLGELPKLADVCVVAHASQLHLVRAIFERYRTCLQLLHYRHGAVFGLRALRHGRAAAAQPPRSLLELSLCCRQVVLIACPDLVADADALASIADNLRLRLARLAFAGSVVLVHAAVGAVSLTRSRPLAGLLQEGEAGGASVAHVHVDRSHEEAWLEALDAALACSLPASPDKPPGAAMDEEEFDRLFVNDRSEVATTPPEDSRFRISNRLWRRYQEANEAAADARGGQLPPELDFSHDDEALTQPLLMAAY